MQPVCQFHQQHSDIFRHGQEQLAKILGLFRLVRLQLQLAELRYTINETADLISKETLDIVQRRDGILDRIVQQAGDDRCRVEFLFRENPGDFHRMRKIWVARGPLLRAVRLHGENISAVESFLIRARVVTTNRFHKLILTYHAAGLIKHDDGASLAINPKTATRAT